MLVVLGAAALVLVAGAPWELPSAAGEPRGLGEGQASGRESWARVTWVPVRSPLTPEPAPASLFSLRTLTWPEPLGGWWVGDQTAAEMRSQPSAICPGPTEE